MLISYHNSLYVYKLQNEIHDVLKFIIQQPQCTLFMLLLSYLLITSILFIFTLQAASCCTMHYHFCF